MPALLRGFMFIDKYNRKWYKGNLHTHTTRSDGAYTPDEALELYRSRGYDFMAITDHWRFHETEEYPGFTLLSGNEYDVGKNVREGVFHILAIGCGSKPDIKKEGVTPQIIVDGIHSAGGIAILAHPAWSLNMPSQITAVKGFDGTEIYNSVSTEPFNCTHRAYSGLIVDMLASNGLDLPLFATDDIHFYEDGADKCRSFIMVNSDSNSAVDIMSAIRVGRFYSTQGPEIYAEMRDGVLHIECSPVSALCVYSDTVHNRKRILLGENITEYDYVPVERDHYLRVEARDSEGKYAWSQIIRL